MADTNDLTPTEERRGVDRRTLVKGAAWAVPVVLVAAPVPAMAASRCTPTTNIDGLQIGSRPTSIPFYGPGLVPTGVEASLTYSSTPGDTGRVLSTTTSPPWRFIELQMVSPLTAGKYIDVTLTFNQPVTGLSFVIHDIDKSQNQWVDQIIVMTPGFSFTAGSAIVGNGTSGSPFVSNQWGDLPIGGGQGSVRVSYPGTVNSIVIRYRAGAAGNALSQHVALGNLSYSACVFPTGGTQRRGAAVEDLSFEGALQDPYFGELEYVGESDTDQ